MSDKQRGVFNENHFCEVFIIGDGAFRMSVCSCRAQSIDRAPAGQKLQDYKIGAGKTDCDQSLQCSASVKTRLQRGHKRGVKGRTAGELTDKCAHLLQIDFPFGPFSKYTDS